MTVAWQVVVVAAGTGAMFFGAAPLLARGLHLRGTGVQLAAMALRLLLAAVLALALGLSRLDHRVALVFTVGAAYFAAAVIDGARHFRRRETKG